MNLSREASNYFTASKSEKSLKHDTKVKGWHVSWSFVDLSMGTFFDAHTPFLSVGKLRGVLSHYRKSGLASLGKSDNSVCACCWLSPPLIANCNSLCVCGPLWGVGEMGAIIRCKPHWLTREARWKHLPACPASSENPHEEQVKPLEKRLKKHAQMIDVIS